MRWPLIMILVALIAVVAVVTFRVASNPLRQSDADLRAWLLAKTPQGTSSNEVRLVLERRGWYTDGFRTTPPRPATDPFSTFLDRSPGGLASALSMFSHEAFRFYLPAYLIADIDGKLISFIYRFATFALATVAAALLGWGCAHRDHGTRLANPGAAEVQPAGARLSTAYAVRLAKEAAPRAGYRLSDYTAPTARSDTVDGRLVWWVSFDGRLATQTE